jgi:hypothetical protein
MKREWIIEIIKNNIQNIVVEDQLSGGDPPYLTHKYHNEWVGYDKAADAILALPLEVPSVSNWGELQKICEHSVLHDNHIACIHPECSPSMVCFAPAHCPMIKEWAKCNTNDPNC